MMTELITPDKELPDGYEWRNCLGPYPLRWAPRGEGVCSRCGGHFETVGEYPIHDVPNHQRMWDIR